MGIRTDDELCDFEHLAVAHEGIDNDPPPDIAAYPQRNMIRNTLKDGLRFEQLWGVNPWKLGFVGSTDTHDAAPGNVGEESWTGAHGANDASPARLVSDEIHEQPGWARGRVGGRELARRALRGAAPARDLRHERDATGGALLRRRARRRPLRQAGPRRARVCHRHADGRRPGTGGRAPRSALPRVGGQGPRERRAARHRSPARPDREGWVDATGTTHERVFDVAGDPANGAGVDPSTCAPTGSGARELCTAWQDPDLDAQAPAFYYARVLENPTCRWSTRVCKAAGVDPFSADCAAQADVAGADFANCSRSTGNDAFLAPTVQERAWTSPVWYRSDGIARVRGTVAFGHGAGNGALSLRIWIGHGSTLDPGTRDVTVRVTDGGTIFAVTIPAGMLSRRGHHALA
jgi:uncharacterized protein DUF3604